MITNLAFTLCQSEDLECCSKQSVFSRCVIPTMDVCLCACTCVWLSAFFQHCALQSCPCFISRNKQQSKWSSRCRRISIPAPWTQYRVNSHPHDKPHSGNCSQGGCQLSSHPPHGFGKLFKFIIIYKVNTHNEKVSLWCGSIFEALVTYIADALCVRGEAGTGWGITRV